MTKFSDFIRNASSEEKNDVYTEVMKKAAQRQRKVTGREPGYEPILCGYCKLYYTEHPVLHCLYTYNPILDSSGVIVGYEMIDSPIGAVHGTNQPSP